MSAKVAEEMAMSLEDWLGMPEGPPYYELEDGRLIEMPSPRMEHQRIVFKLAALLDEWAARHDLGVVVMAVDVALPTGRGYIPDLAFIRKGREGVIGSDGKVHGVPDLVVEVMSPTTRSRDRYRKFRGYFDAGVEWYWIVDAEGLGMEEYRLTPDGYLCTAISGEGEVFEPKAFPGLRINLKELVKIEGVSSQG